MASRPLVSAIIIFLDEARFIEEAVASVLAQTYERWELLLVDDGSTDASTEIARCYAAKHPERIRYLEHEGHRNLGMSAARNLGVAHARGELVAFLDADDVWLPPKLEEQVAVFDAHPEAGMVYGRTLLWYSWTGDPADAGRDGTFDLGVPADTLVRPPRLFQVLLENRAQSPTTCNAIMRRELIDAVGGFEARFRGMYEDYAFFAKTHLRTPVYVAGACWAKYRQHPASCSVVSRRTGAYHVARRPFLTWLAGYVQAQGIGRDSEVGRAVSRQLWAAEHPRLHRLRRRTSRWVRRLKQRLRRVP